MSAYAAHIGYVFGDCLLKFNYFSNVMSEHCCVQERCQLRRLLKKTYGDADSYCEEYGNADDLGRAECPFAESLSLNQLTRDMDDTYSKQFEQ